MKGFRDLGDLDEDRRIGEIGEAAMTRRVAFIVEDEPGKPERYIWKLRERFPGLSTGGPWRGPVSGTVIITVWKADA